MVRKYLLIFTALILALFSNCPLTQAAEQALLINEIYPNPVTGEVEWIEILNLTEQDVSLDGFTIEDATGVPKKLDLCIVPASGYLLLEKGSGDCKFSFTLNNDGDSVILKSSLGVEDSVVYGKLAANAPVPVQGESIARSPDGEDSDLDSEDFIREPNPTPGEKNNEPLPPLPPVKPPINLQTQILAKSVNFSWETADTQDLTYEIIIIKDEDPIIDEFVTDNLNLSYMASLEWGSYTWQIIASNGEEEVSVDGPPFTLVPPVYSKKVYVNEILPHPSTGADSEFIELYNSGLEQVDLSGWFLDDLANGGSAPYEIPLGTIIGPQEYLVFYKSETKLSLNDSGDSARLIAPDGTIISSCSFTETASLDIGLAKDKDGDWEWTEEITPGEKNNIYLTPEDDDDEDGKGGDDEDIIVNTVPIEIKTGDYRNFNEKLVAVTGTIISTSGNTFYLDDGTGQAKIYLQDSKGIDKPPMHKGDIFTIIGIVNLYRNSWRILPQKQSDVKLIECLRDEAEETKTSTASTTKKTTSSTSAKSTAQARAPTSTAIAKEVKAAQVSVPSEVSDNVIAPAWWIQMIKVLTGLSVIFLVLLIIKLRKRPNIKIIGGRFGNDET